MSIEKRAEAYVSKRYGEQYLSAEIAYIAGATEQQALSEAELQKYKTLYEELESIQYPLENRAILAEARIKELEEENEKLKRKLKIAQNTYWDEID